MNYLSTPNSYSSYSPKKMMSPATAYSHNQSHSRSSANLFNSVRSQLNDMISDAEAKKHHAFMGLSAVYKANEELLAQLGGETTDLQAQNDQLRRQLDEALREIIRLNRIIAELRAENQMLRRKMGAHRPYDDYDLLRDLQQLRAEGESLRVNTIRLLKSR